MPSPTVAPLVLSVGIALLASAFALGTLFAAVGLILFAVGLGMWISQLLPGCGHAHEPLVAPHLRPKPVVPVVGNVAHLEQGMPGYRLRLPVKVHPISAGVKGGLIGGIIMPIPAFLYGILSGHGIWMPINLLSGMVLPSVGDLSVAELEQFRPVLLIMGIFIHATTCLILGLVYGVLMPTLPYIARPLAWSALLMPVLWTAVSFVALTFVNPEISQQIDWPAFIASQFIFGVSAAAFCLRWLELHPIRGGLLGGLVGGLLMPIPALIWSLSAGHGLWYPLNLLAAFAIRHADEMPLAQLEQFHPEWVLPAIGLHITMSLSFGFLLGLLLPMLPRIPAPLAWGGLVMPLLWTAASFGLMGVVNPVLQDRVDWPWFVASQFVFGIVAAIVVVRSEQIHVPPAGRGQEPVEKYIGGEAEVPS